MFISTLIVFHVVPLKVYIYDWPDHISDVYPKPNVPLVSGPRGRGRVSIYKKHSYRENLFFGEAIIPEIGLFDTFTFALYKLILARLQQHPSRTYNRSEADLFFIPYDIGYNVIISPETGRERSMVWQGCDIAPNASHHLKTEISTSKNPSEFGHNHFIIFDLSIAHHMNTNCYEFLHLCGNCSVFGLETMLYNTPFTDWMEEDMHTPVVRKWQGIPFPAAIHWHEGIMRLPWAVGAFQRNKLAVYWGSTYVQNKYAVRIRTTLVQQCSATGLDDCEVYGNKGGRSMNNASALLVYTNATFCLQPPGDAETRKGFFDSLLLGCIPVVFSPQAFHRVYGWHVSRAQGEEISVYIPSTGVVNNTTDVIAFLRAIPKEQVQCSIV